MKANNMSMERENSPTTLPDSKHIPENHLSTKTPLLLQQMTSDTSKYDYRSDNCAFLFIVLNYVNSIVGSGVIGMAHAVKETGFGFGILLLIISGFATDYSLVLLIESAEIVGVTTYQHLAEEVFGRCGYIGMTGLQFMFPLAAIVGYNVIVGDTMTKVVIHLTGISSTSFFVRREFVTVVMTLVVTLPLSLYRDISRLGKYSLSGLIIVVFVAIAVIYRMPTMRELVKETPDAWIFAKSTFPYGIAIFASAYLCHHSSFLVYESMRDKTQWNKATHIAIGISGAVITVYAIAGYLSFTEYSQGDLFENYCWKDALMNICRALYVVTLLMTYPIECFVCREVLNNLFFSESRPQTFYSHVAFTLGIVFTTLLLSFTTDCLGLILKIIGLTCAIPMAYIIPSLCYVLVKKGSAFCPSKVAAWAVIIGGIITLISGFYNLIVSHHSLITCSNGYEMNYCLKFNSTF